MPTRQRILECAADLFAKNGYTETSIRDLAAAAGLNAASIYNHFPSKNAILDCLLEDYAVHSSAVYLSKNIPATLQANPTPDGMMACMSLQFPEDQLQYYLAILFVLMQEQHRNDPIRSFVSENLISRSENNIFSIVESLKDLGVIRQDTDADYWMKVCSSLLYTFASRLMLQIGDSSPGFVGLGMSDMLKRTFAIMLETCSVREGE